VEVSFVHCPVAISKTPMNPALGAPILKRDKAVRTGLRAPAAMNQGFCGTGDCSRCCEQTGSGRHAGFAWTTGALATKKWPYRNPTCCLKFWFWNLFAYCFPCNIVPKQANSPSHWPRLSSESVGVVVLVKHGPCVPPRRLPNTWLYCRDVVRTTHLLISKTATGSIRKIFSDVSRLQFSWHSSFGTQPCHNHR